MKSVPLVRPAMVMAVLCTGSLHAQGSPWTNLGGGKAGRFGKPILYASELELGKPMQIGLASAAARSPAHFVLGFKRGDVPFLGSTLVPTTDLIVSMGTDGFGNASFTIRVPADPRLIGEKLFFQCVVTDNSASYSAAFSNALSNAFCTTQRSVVEDFRSSQFLNKDSSAGTWGGGKVSFGPIGGSGIHGVFDATIGRDRTPPGSKIKVYEWSTDSMVIPGSHTSTGKAITVTDGRFYFQKLKIPAEVEVWFVGSNPARIWVQGKMRIVGLISGSGESIAVTNARIQKDNRPQPGEKGGVPGCFGGRGGRGGDRGNGDGKVHAEYHGASGENVVLLSGHAYALRAFGTFGRGSPQHPAHNDNSKLGFGYFSVIALHMNRGGGGGGFTWPGGPGSVKWLPPDPHKGSTWMATGVTKGGIGMAFPATFPNYTNGFTHQDHFLGGGSGGGGGGSCTGGAIRTVTTESYWRIGRAGAGGGGAIGFRIGGELIVERGGRILCEGGKAAFDDSQFIVRGMMTPGGGGSGGSLFMQIHRTTSNLGLISVKGGAGGVTKGSYGDTLFRGAVATGGAGSNGILHFETSGDPRNYPVGTTVPAMPPVAKLDPKEMDDLVAVRSQWYPVSLLFPPTFIRYEIEAVIGGKAVTYSDDPAVGQLASGTSSPLRFTVQGAQLERNAVGKLVPKPNTTPTRFTPYVGPFSTKQPSLHGSKSTGYRFVLTLDRGLNQTVDIKKVTVFWCL